MTHNDVRRASSEIAYCRAAAGIVGIMVVSAFIAFDFDTGNSVENLLLVLGTLIAVEFGLRIWLARSNGRSTGKAPKGRGEME